MIAFQNFKRRVFGQSKSSERENSKNNSISDLNDKENSGVLEQKVKNYEFNSKPSSSKHPSSLSQTRAGSEEQLSQKNKMPNKT
jgi:hypothetical protein